MVLENYYLFDIKFNGDTLFTVIASLIVFISGVLINIVADWLKIRIERKRLKKLYIHDLFGFSNQVLHQSKKFEITINSLNLESKQLFQFSKVMIYNKEHFSYINRYSHFSLFRDYSTINFLGLKLYWLFSKKRKRDALKIPRRILMPISLIDLIEFNSNYLIKFILEAESRYNLQNEKRNQHYLNLSALFANFSFKKYGRLNPTINSKNLQDDFIIEFWEVFNKYRSLTILEQRNQVKTINDFIEPAFEICNKYTDIETSNAIAQELVLLKYAINEQIIILNQTKEIFTGSKFRFKKIYILTNKLAQLYQRL